MIGDEKFKHYVILGQAVNDAKAAEHVSVSGDIVVSPGAWGHLAEENYDVTHTHGGNVKVSVNTYLLYDSIFFILFERGYMSLRP